MYLTISVNKIGGHRQSWGVISGGSFLFFCFPPKVAKLVNLICQKRSRIIGTAEHGVVSNSASK